ncbi:phosphoribosyltransferase [Archaeoglobus profundus]|uniref:Phosphoribosyltransferase n=1 Tax=Archaeoglobus profundus (strain DSM 5631 / JCM 9629 / NBRC 100127 / Av18) TaxID=572546 RepID=D2REW9_ARCPA|nr:phosphoribosyltransferase [Archaeoglobus profundus]ADB58663.1 phosphoribosyltransferase [Archaeoglobus profundus DSM 5631]
MFKCVQYSWDDVYKLCKELARKIKNSGFKPDAIVAVARGGWVPARILADFLLIRELYSVKAEHWGIVATVTGKARITQPLMVDLTGKSVLVVDDVADTGETVEIVAQHVREKNAKEVRTAVIDFKHTSKFVPDYYAREMEKWAWIVYPWSIYEDVKDLIVKLNEGGNAEEIARKLEEKFNLKVDPSVVEEVLKDC